MVTVESGEQAPDNAIERPMGHSLAVRHLFDDNDLPASTCMVQGREPLVVFLPF